MKYARFNFSHSVKGYACLVPLAVSDPAAGHRFAFDTGEGADLVVALAGIPKGRWKITLEWVYEERYFTHSLEIDIQEEACSGRNLTGLRCKAKRRVTKMK